MNDNETSMIKKIGSFIVKKRMVLICLVVMAFNVINFVIPRFYESKTKNIYKNANAVTQAQQVEAKNTNIDYNENYENIFVFDNANILEADNYHNIQSQAQAMYNEHGVGVYTVIVPEMAEKNEERIDDYVWSFATQFTNQVSISDDTVLLFICVEDGNRWREALAFGPIHKKLTPSRLRTIQDSITPALSKGSYYNAIKVYYNLSNGYIMGKEPFNYIGHGIILLISLAIATAVIIYLVKTAGGKMTVNHRTYSNGSAEVIGKHDQYLHTTTTRRTISRSSSGGGGGSSRGGGGRF